MIKRPFICLTKPKINYELMGGKMAEPEKIALPKTVTLLLKSPFSSTDALIKVGDRVKTGQKIMLSEDSAYVISSVTGKITTIVPFYGDYGSIFTAITIRTETKEEIDETFGSLKEEVTLQTVMDNLAFCPGAPVFKSFADTGKPIHTIVVYGGNTDLLIATNQYIIRSQIEDITAGIAALKKATGVEKVIMAVPRDLVPGFGHIGAELKGVDLSYPSAMPKIIMDRELNQPVPAGKECEDLGVTFISAEAVSSIGKAFSTGVIPNEKIVTLVKKDGAMKLVSAKLGTPIKEIFASNKVTVNEKDRLIIGGPLTGSSIYSEDYPISPDTDAIIVQDAADVSLVSDYPCINCGECIRICPSRIQVNMLVRLCEAGLYQAAADEYDLYSCVDCGLCSAICVAKIPVFQYIKLAKYELARMNAEKAAEAAEKAEETEEVASTEATNE